MAVIAQQGGHGHRCSPKRECYRERSCTKSRNREAQLAAEIRWFVTGPGGEWRYPFTESTIYRGSFLSQRFSRTTNIIFCLCRRASRVDG